MATATMSAQGCTSTAPAQCRLAFFKSQVDVQLQRFVMLGCEENYKTKAVKAVLCCAVLCCAVLRCAVLCCAVLRCAALRSQLVCLASSSVK